MTIEFGTYHYGISKKKWFIPLVCIITDIKAWTQDSQHKVPKSGFIIIQKWPQGKNYIAKTTLRNFFYVRSFNSLLLTIMVFYLHKFYTRDRKPNSIFSSLVINCFILSFNTGNTAFISPGLYLLQFSCNKEKCLI